MILSNKFNVKYDSAKRKRKKDFSPAVYNSDQNK